MKYVWIILSLIIAAISYALYRRVPLPCGPCEKPEWWYQCSSGGEDSDNCKKFSAYEA
jgi:hypothetical protein